MTMFQKVWFLLASVSTLCFTEIALIGIFFAKPGTSGRDCEVCTLLFTILSHVKQYNNIKSSQVLPTFCSYLPNFYREACYLSNLAYGSTVTKELDSGESSDVICHGLSFCLVVAGQPVCNLLPEPSQGFPMAINAALNRNKLWRQRIEVNPTKVQFCDFPSLESLCNNTKASSQKKNKPIFDIDNDGYSTVEVLHGHNWKGYDCNDLNRVTYPGRKPILNDVFSDSNCNGIWGIDPITWIPYEVEFCQDSEARGLLIFGDSVASHFHIPPEWLDVTKYSKKIFANLSPVLANTFGWPQLSFGTGHINNTWDIVDQTVTTDSIYWRLRSRNLCNNNDYHNLAYNGGNSKNIFKKGNLNFSRNHERDKPVFAIYAMTGNDVCNSHIDTVKDMTTPEQFRENMLQFYNTMEDVLPFGSHILTIGVIASGDLLYTTMSEHLHPLGLLNGDITYKSIFKWLDCKNALPCKGWMTPDEALRNLTTKRAQELNAVSQELAKNLKYKNFDIQYMELPFKEWITKLGDDAYKLIEPVDGFHPNRLSQSLIADVVWKYLMEKNPEFLGKENARNHLIKYIFHI